MSKCATTRQRYTHSRSVQNCNNQREIYTFWAVFKTCNNQTDMYTFWAVFEIATTRERYTHSGWCPIKQQSDSCNHISGQVVPWKYKHILSLNSNTEFDECQPISTTNIAQWNYQKWTGFILVWWHRCIRTISKIKKFLTLQIAKLSVMFSKEGLLPNTGWHSTDTGMVPVDPGVHAKQITTKYNNLTVKSILKSLVIDQDVHPI